MTEGRETAQNILLVGGGKMGTALLAGWLEGVESLLSVDVIEPQPSEEFEALVSRHSGRVTPHTELLVDELKIAPNVVLFAIKPQIFGEVVPVYRAFVGEGSLFVSIAAGKTIAEYETNLGTDARIVRAMPNTPAAVGRGITVLTGNRHVDERDRELATTLLGAVGATAWIDGEDDMDAVTALSGSGPAYVFLLIECLTKAGIELGLEADLAEELARETVAGAGELARRTDEHASELRENVTSAGGTTEAALEVLMATTAGGAGHAMGELFSRALKAAADRSRELAS